jgi:RNA polymerase sigma-70 factor (ECF subfamily)
MEKKPEETDVELMLRVQGDDEEALAALIRRYQDAMFNFFRSMGLADDAEDAAQETFLRIYRFRHRYEPKATFRTFIYAVARNVSIDAFRKRKRHDQFKEEFQLDAPSEPGSPHGQGGRAALAEELLHSLPDAMREVVVLNVYQGLRYGEISAALEIPVGTVKSRMFHAMLRLREMLNAKQPGQ